MKFSLLKAATTAIIVFTESLTCTAAPVKPSPFVHGHYVLQRATQVAPYDSHATSVLIVDKGSHFTHVLQLRNHEICRVYSVSNSVGKDGWSTPSGRYHVLKMRRWPSWIPPKRIDSRQKAIHPYNKDRKNPLGVAAIHLNKFGILLHGTNDPTSIRRNVSHGCIRHSNKDIAKIYGMVHPGTVVYVVNRYHGKVLQQKDFW